MDNPAAKERCILHGYPSGECPKCAPTSKPVLIHKDISALIAEFFNNLPVKALKDVPQDIALRIGDLMVDNGYRIVFNRWYLQAEPRAADEPSDDRAALLARLTECEILLKSYAPKDSYFERWQIGGRAKECPGCSSPTKCEQDGCAIKRASQPPSGELAAELEQCMSDADWNEQSRANLRRLAGLPPTKEARRERNRERYADLGVLPTERPDETKGDL